MSEQVERLKNEQTALICELHVLGLRKAAVEQRLDRVSHTLAGYELAEKDAAEKANSVPVPEAAP